MRRFGHAGRASQGDKVTEGRWNRFRRFGELWLLNGGRWARGNGCCSRLWRSAWPFQLVAALLDALAREDRNGHFAHVVADASSKRLAIARLHRALDGGGAAETDITAFARHMLLASIKSGAAVAAAGWRRPVAP
jgi:hypothetical protein